MSTRLQFRLSADEAREIQLRRPPEITLSEWLRQLALGQPVQRSRGRTHSSAPTPAGSAADQAKARALASLATQLSDFLRRCSQEPGRLPPALEAELRELSGHIRSQLLSS